MERRTLTYVVGGEEKIIKIFNNMFSMN
jgi:hypothetical protein